MFPLELFRNSLYDVCSIVCCHPCIFHLVCDGPLFCYRQKYLCDFIRVVLTCDMLRFQNPRSLLPLSGRAVVDKVRSDTNVGLDSLRCPKVGRQSDRLWYRELMFHFLPTGNFHRPEVSCDSLVRRHLISWFQYMKKLTESLPSTIESG